MQHARPGDGGDEDDGAASGADHVAAAGLGDEEGTGEVDVEEPAEHGRVVGFGFDVRAAYDIGSTFPCGRSLSVHIKAW